MGEFDGPRLGDTVDTCQNIVLRWNLAKLIQEATCMTCGEVVHQVTAEAVGARQPLPAVIPHDCKPVVYLGDPEPIKHEE